MSESEIRKIGASITNDEFEVNADLSQIFSWSLGCSIIVEDTNADIQEIKTNDICLSGIVYIEELTVDINRVVFSNGLNVDFGITELDVNFGVGGVGGIGGAIIDEIGELKDSLKDVNDALVGINQESVNIKATINGIQSTVNDIGTELVNKASVESVTEIGASITEIQNNQYEQSVKLDVLGTEISTKASSESVTKIADVLAITNQTLAEQTTKVNDIGVQITTKAEASQVTEIEEGLKAASDSIAEQSTKVTALESQISTKAETETVTQLGESINIVSENVAEQIIRTDGIEASIENLVTNEVFNAATGEIESSITSVEQRTESIETTIKSQGGEITSIKENVSGLSIGIGNLESDLDSLRNQMDGASRYLDNITNDGILTPIEKEQLFEIYRSIAREYDATRSNAFNYKVWKYSNDGVTEESGLNGGEGRYESYVAFKNAYTAIANVFSSSMWGFTKMDESTTLPEGYTTTLLKSYLDTYYEKYGILTESFSAITAAIEAAQKATEETLQGLTDNLRPEEMSTIVGKGVVLSTIIATKDGSGKLTAGINGSLDQNKGEKSIAAWFGGDVVDVELDTDKPNPASSVIRHDGTGYFAKGLFSWDGNTGINLGRGGININYDGSLDFGDDIRIGGTETLGSLLKIVSKLSSMWRLEDGVLKTNYDVLTNGQFAAAAVGAEGGGSVGATYLSDLYDVSLGSLLSGDILSWNGSEWVNIKQSSLVPDLSSYATKSFVSDALEGYLPKSGGTISGILTINDLSSANPFIYFQANGSTRAGVGYYSDYGTYIYNAASGTILGIKDDGTPHYNMSTIIHSGNIGSQSVSYASNAGTLGGYAASAYATFGNGTTYISFDFAADYRALGQGDGHIEFYDGGWYNSMWGKVTAVNGFIGNLSGNADSATKLQTPRTIWGQSFDGTSGVSGTMRYVSTIHFATYDNGSYGIYQGNWYAEGLSNRDLALHFDKVHFSGNVLIGSTTDRGHRLTVGRPDGAANLTSTTLNNSLLFVGMSESVYSYGTNFWTEGSGNGFIQQGRTDDEQPALYDLILQPFGRNVGIGTPNPAYKLDVTGTLRVTDTLTAQNGIVTNEITIGGIKLDVVNGALRVNGDIFSTGQFAASVAGEATGGSNIVLDYASIVNALGYTPANNNNIAQVAFTGSYTDLSNKPTSLPASDVYSWAKASVKPTYSWSEIQSRPDVYTKQEVDDKLSDIEGGGGEGCNCDDSTSGLGDTMSLSDLNSSSYDVPNGVNCVMVYESATLDFSSVIPLDPSRPCIMYLVKTDDYTLQVTYSSNITSANSSGGLSEQFSVDGYTGMMLVWDTDYWKWHAYIQRM